MFFWGFSFPTPPCPPPQPWIPGYVNSSVRRRTYPAHSARVEMDLDREAEIPHPSSSSATYFCNKRTYVFIKLLTFRSIFTVSSCVQFGLVAGMLSTMACFVQSLATSGIVHALPQQSFTEGVTMGKKEPGFPPSRRDLQTENYH